MLVDVRHGCGERAGEEGPREIKTRRSYANKRPKKTLGFPDHNAHNHTLHTHAPGTTTPGSYSRVGSGNDGRFSSEERHHVVRSAARRLDRGPAGDGPHLGTVGGTGSESLRLRRPGVAQ